MIYVTQGHENGVGLEIFLKSILCLPRRRTSLITLIAFSDSVSKTLKTLKIDFSIINGLIHIGSSQVTLLEPDKSLNKLPESSACLSYALSKISPNDTLFTLPTSKDQLVFNNKQKNGYTEYLRSHFNDSDLTMCFLASDFSVALLSDHIPLKEVSSKLNKKVVIKKTLNALKILSYFRSYNEVILSGINPHAGEGGLIGSEDVIISEAISELKQQLPLLKFYGPIPGDTIFFQKQLPDQLFVYAYHDQGLGVFKSNYGLIGVNITCGLPFIRVSVDHGTAFELYGKNCANYQGCLFVLEMLTRTSKN